MAYRKAWICLTLACTSMAAQAEILELVFDVTGTTRETMHVDGPGNAPWQVDASFTPQDFSVTVRLDTASARYSTDTAPDGTQHASTGFDATLSATPYTGEMRAGFPAGYPGGGTLAQTLPPAPSSGDPASADVRFRTFNATAYQVGSTSSQYTRFWYSLETLLQLPGQPVLPGDFHALDGAEIAQWLRSQVGTTFADGYSESTMDISYKVLSQPNPPVLTPPIEQTSANGLRYGGDLTLRSVTAVPEASTLAMAGIGLLAAARMARRQRAAGAVQAG